MQMNICGIVLFTCPPPTYGFVSKQDLLMLPKSIPKGKSPVSGGHNIKQITSVVVANPKPYCYVKISK